MDEIIQIATNAIPVKAVFANGEVTPVIGLALVRGEFDKLAMNVPGGIAIFNDGLVVCEQVDGFFGYAADDVEAKAIFERKSKKEEVEVVE